MVKITNYKEVESKTGKVFFMLELSEGVELAISKSGNSYLTEKKTFISSTFDEEKSKSVIGMNLQGSIVRENVEEYSYINASGDVITLNHRYVYCPDVVSEENVRKEELEMA